MGISWGPKGTITATLSGMILTESKALGDQYKEY